MLKIYNGGSHNDVTLWTTDFLSTSIDVNIITSIKSSGNQIFIEVLNDAYGYKINFSASITFGKSSMS